MFEQVRRVVTVIGADGVSRFESDGAPPITRRLPNATEVERIGRGTRPARSTDPAAQWRSCAEERGATEPAARETNAYQHSAQVAIDEIWRFPALPADATAPGDVEEFSFLSPEQGFVVRRVEVPPDRDKFVDDHGHPREPEPHEGTHQTPTIDIIQMLEGELWCLLDSGEETCLQPGDVLVQRGMVHAWRNRTDRPVRYLALMVSATLPFPIEHHANP